MAGLLSRLSLASFALVAGAGLVLGGCTQQKAKQADLMNENTTLRKESDELKDQLAKEQAARQQAEAEKAAALARAQEAASKMTQVTPGPGPDYGNTNNNGGGGGKRGGGSPQGNVVITVAGDVLFGPGQATLSAAGKKELDGVAAQIKRDYRSNRIRIEGYTDSDPVKRSSWGSNEKLSAARAVAVEKYLATKGINKNRMESVGMGSANPKSTKKDSRRVEIVILGN